MLPFNTSAFSNLLGASDRAAQRKAVVAPFDVFDAKAEDVMQHIAQFTQRCEETGLIKDFNFIVIFIIFINFPCFFLLQIWSLYPLWDCSWEVVFW